MSRGAWIFLMSVSIVVIGASTATIILATGHPTVVGCPGSAVSSIIDCRAVVTSSGGHILGLPLGVWGLVWLAAYWILSVWRRGAVGWGVAATAFLGIAYAIGTELKVGHLCAWCTLDQIGIAALAVWRFKHQGGAVHGSGRPA